MTKVCALSIELRSLAHSCFTKKEETGISIIRNKH